MAEWVVAVHLGATAAMVGLIWFVQVVHYPLFARVGADVFAAYEAAHRFRTGLIVGPLMGAETLAAIWLVASPPNDVDRAVAIVGLVIVGVVHLSTMFVQVPLHERLSRGFDPVDGRRLVRTNWVRTVGWTVRGVLAMVMVVQVA
jgi:hypothetical protein